MATTKLNTVILATARRLKAPRTLATDDAGSYTSLLLTEYVNRSIKDLLLDKYIQFGDKAFRELFPEYVKTSGSLTLTSGVTAKPSDCFVVTDLVDSTGLISFKKLSQDEVDDVRRSQNKIIVPSSTRPVFYEEAGNIYTLGITSGTVIARYIQSPSDLTPITTSATNGNWYTGSDGAWTASTRLLAGTMNSSFASTDINKKILFRTATIVYSGTIESFVSTTSVIVRGDGLPTGNIVAGSVVAIMVSDVEIDSSDLKINLYWLAEIIDRAVAYGLKDAKNNVIS